MTAVSVSDIQPEQLRLLVSEFVRAMQRLPQARAIYLSFADDEPRITTFIDAEPFNDTWA